MTKKENYVSEYYEEFDLISVRDIEHKIESIKRMLLNKFSLDLFPYRDIEYVDFVFKCKDDISYFPLYTYLASYKTDFIYKKNKVRGSLYIQLDVEKTQANIDMCIDALKYLNVIK